MVQKRRFREIEMNLNLIVLIALGGMLIPIFGYGVYMSLQPTTTDYNSMTNQELRNLGTNQALDVLCAREPQPHSTPYCGEPITYTPSGPEPLVKTLDQIPSQITLNPEPQPSQTNVDILREFACLTILDEYKRGNWQPTLEERDMCSPIGIYFGVP